MEKNDIEYLMRHLSRADVVLFLGAGFSTEAENIEKEKLPNSRRLAEQLWEYLGYATKFDGSSLGIVYQAALKHPRGTSSLFDFLRSKLRVVSCPEWYRLIAKWYWHRIYTTNVDNLVQFIYERYAKTVGLEVVVAPAEYHERDAFLRTVQLVMLNGSLEDPKRGLTFAPREYGRRAAEQDVWYDHFVRDFSERPTVFVGTELDEPLLWQYIAVRQRRAAHIKERRPKSFIVCQSISKAKQDALSEFNVFPVEATAEEFLELLAKAQERTATREEMLRSIDPTLATLFELQTEGASGKELRLAEAFFSVFRPIHYRESEKANRSHFLLGSPPTWEDMHAHLDAEREINGQVQALVENVLASDSRTTPVIILSGPAGSGKTTIAKRVSLSLASHAHPVYFAESDVRPLPQPILSYLYSVNQQVILFFDNATSDLRLIAELILSCSGLRFKPVIVLSARTNELAIRRYLLQGVENLREIRVPNLSEPDIDAILAKLEAHGLLGDLKKLTAPQRSQVFSQKAKKQILIAMREATRGKGFDEIIQDEFSGIQPLEARLLYLVAALPSMNHSTIRRGQLIASTDLSPSEALSLIEDNLSGILLPYENDTQRLQIRHPLIAEYVVGQVCPRALLAEAYIRFLQVLAHDVPPIRERRGSRLFRVYRDTINHTALHSVFLKQVPLCRKIYESIGHHFQEDGHYWLQYGLYELEFGDLDFAENFLLQADALMHEDPWVRTSIGYLMARKGVEAHSLMAAEEFFNRGVEILRGEIATTKQNPYPYHVLGSQGLAFIRRWVPKSSQAERLRELHREVAEGCKKYPLASQLQNLADAIKKAELETLI